MRVTAPVTMFARAARVGSLLLFAQSGEPGTRRLLAAFDRRIEQLAWCGEDLLLGFAVDAEVCAFSICPGLRIRSAPPPADAAGGLAWLRLSTRRCGR